MTSVPDRAQLIERADALRVRLWEAAPQVDRDRRLPAATFEAMRDAGLIRLFVPERFGGFGAGMRTYLEVTMALGRGCGSSAWVAGVLNTGNWWAASFSEQAQEDVWGSDPLATTAGVLAPTAEVDVVDGGIVLNGKWAYTSGSNHCDWVSVCYPSPVADDPGMHLALVPIQDLTVEDTWYVAGLRGTGSNTVVAHNLFVPAHRLRPVAPFFAGDNTRDGAEVNQRVSLAGLLPLSLAGSQLGQARAALDYTLEKAPKRAITTTSYTSQAESVGFQVDVAEAAGMIDAAVQSTRHAADELDSYATSGELPETAVRTRLRLSMCRAVRTAYQAVDLLMSAHGSSAFAEVNPLQRIWRDAAVGSRHAAFSTRVTQELHGKALLHQNPQAVSFLV